MRRNLALFAANSPEHHARPVTCLACVVVLSTAFWAGAIWIAGVLIHVSRMGY